MFVGDFIKCVNVGNCKEYLTVGKYYEILKLGEVQELGISFFIVTDLGTMSCFSLIHSQIIYFDINSIRDKRIDDILK